MMLFKGRANKDISIRISEIRETTMEEYINAPPQAVWDCISDVRNYHKWATLFKAFPPEGLERVEKPGDTVGYETAIMGIPFRGKIVTLERVPPVRSAFYLLSEYRGGGEYLLEPLNEGTRVHYRIWSEIPASYLGEVVDRVAIAGTARKRMGEHLTGLKKYVEGLLEK